MSSLKKELGNILIGVGVFLTVLAFVLFFFTFRTVISEEVKYIVRSKDTAEKAITPVNENFSIIIPKLGANAPVVAKVDPFNEAEYQIALTKGVAHAKTSVLPNQPGTMFLFAHSAEDFYRANQYNAIFYLLYKLKPEDDIYIYYDKNRTRYKVTELKYVDPNDISYLTQSTAEDRLILMTCWPPGTTVERLIVIAEPVR